MVPLCLTFRVLPETLIVTDDAPDAAQVEDMIKAAAPLVASRLSASVSLDGLGSIALARAQAEPTVQASAYVLGYDWVLQVYGPLQSPSCPPPSVIEQGDSFTLVMTRTVVAGLAAKQFASGNIPMYFNEQGMIEPNGPVRIVNINVVLEPATMVLFWNGVAQGGRQAQIIWRMGFVMTPDGLALQIQQISVDGTVEPLPPAASAVNPIDNLVRAIAVGLTGGGVYAGPLGLVRLEEGYISPDGITISGRA